MPAQSNDYPLPTDRLTVEKQISVARAYAVSAQQGNDRITNEDLGRITGLHPNTASLVNTFFSSIGLITKTGNSYRPSDELLDYQRATQFGNENAAQEYLAPIFANSWFGQALSAVLSIRSTIKEEEALELLAQRAGVGVEEKNRLIMLLDYLQLAGLVVRENNELRAAKPAMQRTEYAPSELQPRVTDYQAPAPPPDRFREPRNIPTTALTFQARGVRVEVEIDEEEAAGWSENRITRFFAGIAQTVSQAMGLDPRE